MLSYPLAPLSVSSATKTEGRRGEGGGRKKVGKKRFSEWGLPGVENVPTPLETIFKLSRAPHRPYIKNRKF